MVEDTVLTSILLVDKLIISTIETINQLEDVKYENIVNSNVINKANLLLNQVYDSRAKRNYRSTLRKCIFLKKYVEKEMRMLDENR